MNAVATGSRDPRDAMRRAIDAATDAARTAGPGGAPVDVAAVLAGIVAGVAANLGSLDRLLAGRSGSWEADLVGQLVTAGLGDDPVTWRAGRTAPVVVRVCVAQVAEDTGVEPLDEALRYSDSIYRPGDAEAFERDGEDAETPEQDAAWAAVNASYATSYSAWGEAFRAAVQAQVQAWPELTAPVLIEVDADPEAPCWLGEYYDHLTEYADDALTAELLTLGREAAGRLVVPDASMPGQVNGDV